MTNINEFDCQGVSPNQYFIEFRLLTILDNGCTGKCHDSDQVLMIMYLFHDEGDFSVAKYTVFIKFAERTHAEYS